MGSGCVGLAMVDILGVGHHRICMIMSHLGDSTLGCDITNRTDRSKVAIGFVLQAGTVPNPCTTSSVSSIVMTLYQSRVSVMTPVGLLKVNRYFVG